jgi:hypothetical protein
MTRSLVLSTLVAAAFSLVLSTSDAEAGRRHRRCCGGRSWGYTNACGGGCHTSFASCNTGCGTYGYQGGYVSGSACGAGGCAPTYSGSGPVPMQNNYAPSTNGNAAPPPPPTDAAPPQPGT